MSLIMQLYILYIIISIESLACLGIGWMVVITLEYRTTRGRFSNNYAIFREICAKLISQGVLCELVTGREPSKSNFLTWFEG